MTDELLGTAIDDEAAPEWAAVEIMGHRCHYGLIREVERFGSKMLMVLEYGPEDTEPYRTHYYGGGSIFSITPCTERYARQECDNKWRWSRRNDGVKALPLLDIIDEPDEEPYVRDPSDAHF